MRVYMSAGEASGDMSAAALAATMRSLYGGHMTLEGIGGERMEAAGFLLRADARGWASMGPIEAVAKIPPLLAVCVREALRLRRTPADLVVLVDFGAFNVRLATLLRRLGYASPIVYYFPPGAWLDDERQARTVARVARPLTAFAHQRDFYRRLGLDVAYFGHPLCSLIAPRVQRPTPAPLAGIVALLPGSRRGELARHLPPLLAAFDLLQERRPKLRGLIAAADADAERRIRGVLAGAAAGEALAVVRGAAQALDVADAAWVASGTAVLEAALREVPTVALYIVAAAQVGLARRIWQRPYITLPNLLLGRAVVPELLQEAAAPAALADALESVMEDPQPQREAMREVRAALGPADALDQCARFVLRAAEAA